MTTAHLSEEQICAYLSDPNGSAAAAAHLAQCSACSDKVAGFHTSVDSFNLTSLSWSEERAARYARPLGVLPSRGHVRTAWTLAACIVLAMTIFGLGRYRSTYVTMTVTNISDDDVRANSETEIAKDNQLMSAVSAEIGRSEPSPFVEYNLPSQSSREGTTRPESRIE